MQTMLTRLPRWVTTLMAVLGVAGIGGLMQLLPIAKDLTNPPVLQEPAWDSPQTRDLTRRACFDCHSNETVWPWYSQIAPLSWMIAQDVFGARATFKCSEGVPDPNLTPQEIHAIVEEGEMPPGLYLLSHPGARLSLAEIRLLADGLSRSMQP